MKNRFLFILLFCLLGSTLRAQSIYFPPLNPNATWDTLSPVSLGWCTDKTDSLYDYLASENTKAFLVLKDGKIVLEKYFGTFTADSAWYWASAGKTLTSFLVGKAKEEGLLKLEDSTQAYLGNGWTVCPPLKERKIKVWNQLTMTSGLNDAVLPDNHCTDPACLQYLADAGTRWAYHNAPYTLLDSVLESATGKNLNLLMTQKLKSLTGMTGAWINSGWNKVYISTPRSMARFGLAVQNGFRWNTTPLLNDTAFARQSLETSQTLNPSYGYLWWLNGKSSYKVPGSQINFPGPLFPDAPMDLVSAIGKNGQFLSISKSTGLVLVRMGDASSSLEVPFLLLGEIWKRFNKVRCVATGNEDWVLNNPVSAFPNPAVNELSVQAPAGSGYRIINRLGQILEEGTLKQSSSQLSIRHLANGLYQLQIQTSTQIQTLRFQKAN